MNNNEIAFYDALEINDSVVKILGDDALRKLHWINPNNQKQCNNRLDARESIQAEIRLKVKKILRKYGYLPDKEKRATEIVLKQAELIAKNWANQ